MIVVALALRDGATGEIRPLPGAGEVAAVLLEDGMPAFIVHDRDGAVRAFDARAPVHAGRRRGLLAWCEPNRVFVDPLHGHSWKPDGAGRVLRGTLPRSDRASDQSPPGLHELPTEASDSAVRLQPAEVDHRPQAWPRPAAKASCPPDGTVRPPVPGTPTTPAELAETSVEDGVWRLTGWLTETANANPRLCAAAPASHPCERATVELAVPPADWLPEGLVQRRRLDVAITIADGRAVELLVAASAASQLVRADASATAVAPHRPDRAK